MISSSSSLIHWLHPRTRSRFNICRPAAAWFTVFVTTLTFAMYILLPLRADNLSRFSTDPIQLLHTTMAPYFPEYSRSLTGSRLTEGTRTVILCRTAVSRSPDHWVTSSDEPFVVAFEARPPVSPDGGCMHGLEQDHSVLL